MNSRAAGTNEAKTAYYMMSMPEWFLDLPNEKKIQIAKDFAKDSPSDKILSKEDIINLLSHSQGE